MPPEHRAATAAGTSPVKSTVWWALRSRRYASSSPGRVVATTYAPRAAASCTANPPTPPVAPEMSTVSPGSGATASTAASAAVPTRPSAPATARSSPAGTPGGIDLERGDVFTERAVAKRGLDDHAEHGVARPR